MGHLCLNLRYFDSHKYERVQFKFKSTTTATTEAALRVHTLLGDACWTLPPCFTGRVQWKYSWLPCVGSASQFSPWKLQMDGIRMTIAGVIIQMVLFAADRIVMMCTSHRNISFSAMLSELVHFPSQVHLYPQLSFQKAGLLLKCEIKECW